MAHPVLGPITRRTEYDAHPVGRPPVTYINTDHAAQRSHIQVLGGKTGYNDIARYCLVISVKIDGRPYFMSFLGNEGKLTRFGDVARVADWIVSHKAKVAPAPAVAAAAPPAAPAAALPAVAAPPAPAPTVATQPAQATTATP